MPPANSASDVGRHSEERGGLRAFLVPPGPDHGFYPFPQESFIKYKTKSGLVLLVPPKVGLVYDAPLLTTPWPQPDLQLRKPGDLGDGFRLSAITNIPIGANSSFADNPAGGSGVVDRQTGP